MDGLGHEDMKRHHKPVHGLYLAVEQIQSEYDDAMPQQSVDCGPCSATLVQGKTACRVFQRAKAWHNDSDTRYA